MIIAFRKMISAILPAMYLSVLNGTCADIDTVTLGS